MRGNGQLGGQDAFRRNPAYPACGVLLMRGTAMCQAEWMPQNGFVFGVQFLYTFIWNISLYRLTQKQTRHSLQGIEFFSQA